MSLHVVFGAGQVGTGLARSLRARGHAVRVVRRSAAPVEGVEVVAGDARDRAFAARAAEGAAALYHCMNPRSYTGDAWEAELPALGDALIGAAIEARARLVVLDNLYGYGVVDGRRTEDTPLRATGRKGRVRVALTARLQAAARDEGLRYTAARAGDFFGPGTGEHSLLSPGSLRKLAAGGSPWLVGDGAATHAFSYVPDVVEGLAALGAAGPDVEGRAWHLPVIEVAPTTLVARIAEALGSSARARVLPAWAVRTLGPVVPLFGELRETLYQWDRPFLVDDARFRARFPGIGTALDAAAEGTAADVR